MIPDLVDEPLAHRPILPPGVHAATPADLRKAFVDGFPQSCTRQKLYEGWEAFRLIIRSLVAVKAEFVDGSFVTGKMNPKDVDVSFWVAGEDVLALGVAGQNALAGLADVATYDVFSVDAYIVPECEPGHPLYDEFVEQRDWTEKAWVTPRDTRGRLLLGSVTKGYVEVVA